MHNRRPSLSPAAVPFGLTMALVLAVPGGPALAQEEDAIVSILQGLPNNWGRWGEDDQVGALNFLGPEEVLRGLQAARQGKVFTLQIPMTHGFGPVFPGRIPMMHYMAQDEGQYASGKREVLAGGLKFSDDVMFAYLQGTTHVDALAHAWYGDEVYGGKAALSTVGGHEHADVAAIGERGVVGRGVLLDVGRHKAGEEGRLAPGECVTLEDLMATAEAQGVTIEQHDILVIRVGSIVRFFEDEPDQPWDALTEPGLCHSRELVEWLHDTEIPLIAADNLGVELVVQEIEGETVVIPLHGALMRDLGIVLSEIHWLEDLARDSAEDGQYTFLFAAAPLKVEGGTGAPVNPIVVK